MGPLVYLLPVVSPLRMIDEICMLDHFLKHGRAEIGVGRGVSPLEPQVQQGRPGKVARHLHRRLSLHLQGPDHRRAHYKGPYYEYENVPIALSPYQKPFPPFWYGSSGDEGSPGRARRGCISSPSSQKPSARANIDTFKKALGKRGGKPAQPKPEFSGGVALGVQRHIFVDETDEKAPCLGTTMNKHLEHINWIRTRHGVTATQARIRSTRGANYDECLEEGTVIAGSPDTVLKGIKRRAKEIGFNYLLAYLFLGNMPFDIAMRSLKLFIKDVMPAVERM